MSVADAKTLFRTTLKRRAGIGAFNITSLAQIDAFVAAAVGADSPLIVQVTGPVVEFLGPEAVAAVFGVHAERCVQPVVLHLDHTSSPELIAAAARAGFGSVMFDGSRLGLEENIDRTKRVVSMVRRLERSLGREIAVEAELGAIGGVEEGASTGTTPGATAALCDPAEAVRFVEETGVDLLAPAIGTAHGFYRTADPHIDFRRVERIGKRLEEAGIATPLVVHGGTGLPRKTLHALIDVGFVKVNISTVLKKTLIDTAYDYISKHRGEYDPTRIDEAVRAATMRCVAEHISMLRTERPSGEAAGDVDRIARRRGEDAGCE